MPNNWKTYKLSDIGEIIGGGTPSTSKQEYYNGDIPWITPRDLSNHSSMFISKGERSITELGLKNSSAKLMPEGTVLLTSRAPIGYLAISENQVCTNQGFKSIIVNQNLVNNKFIYYLLKSNIDLLLQNASGSTFQEISGSVVKNLEFHFPPLKEQKSIASILSAIDEKIENNLAINKTLEEMAMALYKHWFVDFGPFQDGEFVESELGRIPKGWEVKRLDEIADFINGYAFKSGELKNDNNGNSYHIFKMGHIERGGGLKENATKSYIDKSKCEKLEKYILKVGDLLMAMTDMKDNVAILGNTALINENDKYIVNQRVGLIRPNNDIGIDYSFLYLITNENSFIERLRSQANSGVQVNLSTDAIKSAKMVIGSKEINLNFDDIVKPLYDNIFQNKIENQTLTQLRDTLLPKLISGEVRLKEFRE